MSVTVVIPTIGRPSLGRLLTALDRGNGPAPDAVIVVDDRRESGPLEMPAVGLPLKVLHSAGRGPAAARNMGWRAAATEWICFVDDDVVTGADWPAELAADIRAVRSDVLGVQGRISVPQPAGRRATDDERRTLQLEGSLWITADMAYRRAALVACGGFDERFPRAYREDADIALRLIRSGARIVTATRQTTHPVAHRSPSILASVRAQVGNRDDALMRRKHGRGWRAAIGGQRGRLRSHALTTSAAVAALGGAVVGRRWVAFGGALAWLIMTVEFAARRIAAGPRTLREAVSMVVSSALIPPVAVSQRLWGSWCFRKSRPEPPLAVLFDRDDTLIEDGPYLGDPDGVVPKPGAHRALERLRRHGLLLAVVSNQSGVAKGLITEAQLQSVNDRVDELLGPFDSWHVCIHGPDEGCSCRKPLPGMVVAAADALGVATNRCVVIGDIGADVVAARSANAEAILVPTSRTRREEVYEARRRARVAASLDDAVSIVLRGWR